MTPADIKRIASDAGFGFDPTFGRCCPKPMWLAEPAELTRFAALVRAQALEQAARVCDEIGEAGRRWPDGDEGSKSNVRAVRAMVSDAGDVFAAAIRALGDTK